MNHLSFRCYYYLERQHEFPLVAVIAHQEEPIYPKWNKLQLHDWVYNCPSHTFMIYVNAKAVRNCMVLIFHFLSYLFFCCPQNSLFWIPYAFIILYLCSTLISSEIIFSNIVLIIYSWSVCINEWGANGNAISWIFWGFYSILIYLWPVTLLCIYQCSCWHECFPNVVALYYRKWLIICGTVQINTNLTITGRWYFSSVNYGVFVFIFLPELSIQTRILIYIPNPNFLQLLLYHGGIGKGEKGILSDKYVMLSAKCRVNTIIDWKF